MPPTFTTSQLSVSKIFIDWTDLNADQDGQSIERVDRLVSWIRTYPCTRDIRVYLRNSPHAGNRLQRTLQSLGCTVTARWA